MKEINLESEFKTYLKRVELDILTMSAIQLQETKRAFFAGLAQMWVMFIELSDLPEEITDVMFGEINDQINIFWLNETNSTDNRKKE